MLYTALMSRYCCVKTRIALLNVLSSSFNIEARFSITGIASCVPQTVDAMRPICKTELVLSKPRLHSQVFGMCLGVSAVTLHKF